MFSCIEFCEEEEENDDDDVLENGGSSEFIGVDND
jgi:hypothetical protein